MNLDYKTPYVYRKFPKMVYGPKGAIRVVNDEEQLADAEKAGFSDAPAKAHRDALQVPKVSKEAAE